jgi:hypothetical protein
MGNPIQKIKTSESTCTVALLQDEISSRFSTVWTIGNLDILDTHLLGIFSPAPDRRRRGDRPVAPKIIKTCNR